MTWDAIMVKRGEVLSPPDSILGLYRGYIGIMEEKMETLQYIGVL